MSKIAKILLILLIISGVTNVFFLIHYKGQIKEAKETEVSELRIKESGIPKSPMPTTPEIKIKNPVLEVKVLKVYAPYGIVEHTQIDIQVTNKSDKFIAYWEIGADIFNDRGEYLGHSFTNGHNLRPGQSVTGEISYLDVSSLQVASWKTSIGGVSLDLDSGERFDATRYFELEEVR